MDDLGRMYPGPIGIGDHDDFRSALLDIGAVRSALPGPLMAVPCAAEFHRNKNHKSEFDLFRDAVLAQQIANNKKNGRPYYDAVPPGALTPVQGEYQLRTPAALECIRMIAAIKKDKPQKVDVFLRSAYRDYDQDRDVWMRNFKRIYYPNTKAIRKKMKGGEHGPAAVRFMAIYISTKKAAPGFSNHSNGIAVDFETNELGIAHKIDTSDESRAGWQKTWLHAWLVGHAAAYNFYELKTEEWHWEYHPGDVPKNLYDR